MKRLQDRESSPRSSKRSRGYGVPEHDTGRDRMSPDFERSRRKYMASGSREGKPFRDYDHDVDSGRRFRDERIPVQSFVPPVRGGGGYSDEYRSLCITSISSKIPDADLEEGLFQEFWKYGEMNVKITFSGDQRVAYVNYRYPEDARVAKHKGRNDIFDRPIRIDPVFNKMRSGSPSEFTNHFLAHSRRSPPPYQTHFLPEMGRALMAGGGRQGPPSMGGRGPPFPQERDHIMFVDNLPHTRDNDARKAEKFPYHLDHIDPEFDDRATRTLFIGNLDVSIADLDLKNIFEKYGNVEDIDIKRPQKGQGNAYAFLKFINLDCAHRAKVEMSGKYIGKFQCKIGYGKVTPTTCLWVGGLGPWVSRETLEQEFDRFGAIQRIDWPSGRSFAYVLYDSIDAAKAACQEMRGCPLGGPDRRLRLDFADVSHITNPIFNSELSVRSYGGPDRDFERTWRSPGSPVGREHGGRSEWFGDRPSTGYRSNQRGGDHVSDIIEGRSRAREDWVDGHMENERKRRHQSPGNYDSGPSHHQHNRTPEKRDFHHERSSRDEGRVSGGRGDGPDRDGRRDEKIRRDQVNSANMADVHNLTDLTKNLPVAWNGALVLKNSAFATRMHVVSGDVTIVDTLMRDPTSTESPVLRITQRLRLDQPKLEDVGRRISSAGRHGHCILLAMPSTLLNYDEQSGVAQQRHLKNLVSYLKQKEAAGVISLQPNPDSDKNVGVLHAFPPCQFGYNFLLKHSPQLPPDYSSIKEEYLVIMVVVGSN